MFWLHRKIKLRDGISSDLDIDSERASLNEYQKEKLEKKKDELEERKEKLERIDELEKGIDELLKDEGIKFFIIKICIFCIIAKKLIAK